MERFFGHAMTRHIHWAILFCYVYVLVYHHAYRLQAPSIPGSSVPSDNVFN